MADIRYETVDVFTTTRFGGNQLAVVPDARGLDNATMQRIAAEFNYAETTFVLPPAGPENTARVRIFTPASELPFAGHPNVGTGFVLARHGEAFGRPVGETMRFEEAAGIVEITVIRESGAVAGAEFRAPRPLEIGAPVDTASVAACASLPPEEIVVANHPPTVVSVGLPHATVEVSGLEALGRASPDRAAFAAADAVYRNAEDRFAIFLYARDTTDPARVRARMFAPLIGILEDPATGSACAGLGAFLAALHVESDGVFVYAIEQGIEMGRPSQIRVTARKSGGTVTDVFVAGSCVPVMRGVIELDNVM